MVRSLLIVGLLTLFFFSAFTPPSSVLSKEIVPLPVKMLGSILRVDSAVSPSKKTRPFYTQTDASLAASLDAIAWAVKREDLRACGDLPMHPRASELLTLCVASVQDDEGRCYHINDRALQKLCHEVVAS